MMLVAEKKLESLQDVFGRNPELDEIDHALIALVYSPPGFKECDLIDWLVESWAISASNAWFRIRRLCGYGEFSLSREDWGLGPENIINMVRRELPES